MTARPHPAARWWRHALAVLLALAASLFAGPLRAHELSMAEMQVREMAPGEFLWQWGAGEKAAPADELMPVWPDGCQADGNLLRCGPAGLSGTLAVNGIGQGFSAAMVKVYWRDGQARVYTLTKAQTAVQLHGGADDKRNLGEIARAYTMLGVEHILSGVDHLLFVISLLLLVGFNRRLIGTITAFTAAHSLTLASSALGWLALRPPPVEASIALSIVLVAGEALHQRATLARRFPAMVAFIFGLVHGLGFAGALKDIGLPENHLLPALLTFNIGVEIGQLLTVAAAWALWRVAARWPALGRARTVLLYAIGSVAAYWSWLRVAVILG
jgi:hydrogenase/urease accessory protein HupE